MTITADEAADVARKYGLTLSDAQALTVLADDTGHADRLAQRFTAPESSAEILRQIPRMT